jgi:hypothetical protein
MISHNKAWMWWNYNKLHVALNCWQVVEFDILLKLFLIYYEFGFNLMQLSMKILIKFDIMDHVWFFSNIFLH